MKPNFELGTLPSWLLVLLAVLLIVQVTLDVIALVSLARRERSAVALGNKWIWVAIILLVNTIGAILYFAIGRKPAEAAVEAPSVSKTSMTSVADSLYGAPADNEGS